jgi:hypothetical protein
MRKKIEIINEIKDKYGNKIVLDDALCEKMTEEMFQAVKDGKTKITVDNRLPKNNTL